MLLHRRVHVKIYNVLYVPVLPSLFLLIIPIGIFKKVKTVMVRSVNKRILLYFIILEKYM